MLLFCAEDVQPNDRDKFVSIKDINSTNNHIFYIIEVRFGEIRWIVEKRYSDFYEFDRQRFKHLKQSFLPPKKLVGNQQADFINKRRKELEQYLRTVFELEVWLQKKKRHVAVPRSLAVFLDFHKYEIHAICEELAHNFFHNGEKLLASNDYYEFSPLQLHAITERLKLPEPTCESSDAKLDFGHVLDFVHRLNHLKIKGLKKFAGTSNITPNCLPFNLNVFKNLHSLWIVDCNPSMVSGTNVCRQSSTKLIVHYTLNFLSEILLEKEENGCDSQLKKLILNEPVSYWFSTKNADFSFNQISSIDESVIVLKNVERLDFTCNCLTDINFLQHLPRLSELILSNNRVETLDHWYRKLGNVKKLILSGNKIRSVDGLRRLYCLEYLDLRDNCLVQTNDVRPIGELPCLKILLLSGNPVEASVEYRCRVLESFGDRASELKLDNDATTQRELDTVGVRLAIRKAKEDREKQLFLATEQIGRALNFDSETSSISEKSNNSDSFSDGGTSFNS